MPFLETEDDDVYQCVERKLEHRKEIPLPDLEAQLMETFKKRLWRIVDTSGRDPDKQLIVENDKVLKGSLHHARKLQALYEKAGAENKIITIIISGVEVRYAVVESSRVAEEIIRTCGPGFSLFKPEIWGTPKSRELIAENGMIFVVGDLVPKEFHRYIAIHEIEELTTNSHLRATITEMQMVEKRGREFLRQYLEYWTKTNAKKLKNLQEEEKRNLRTLLPREAVKILRNKGIL